MIHHIIASIDRKYGGPSYSVPALAHAQCALGEAVGIHFVGEATFQETSGKAQPQLFSYAQSCKHILPFVRASVGMKKSLQGLVHAPNILHVHGLWLLPNVYPARVCKKSITSAKLVHSTRGMLSSVALSMSSWKKKPFWHLFQRKALEAADCIHATAMSELEEIRRLGITSPVAVIPNGVSLPAEKKNVFPNRQKRTLLCLGRVHPKKNLDQLIAAWALVEQRYPNWSLRIVGPPELNYDIKLREQAREENLQRVVIEGPVYGNDRIQTYRDADLFVLPTLNENFGLVVAEALAESLPVICTKGAPWEGLVENQCGWWIDHGIESLQQCLEHALSLPSERLHQMGRAGRTWVEKDFGWERAASDTIALYSWLGGQTHRPDFVYTI